MTDPPFHKWVLLTHQIPPRPSGFRVKIWRKLQEIGAIAVKNAVYLLPNTPTSLEDFQWIQQEILDAGGEASIFTADAVENAENRGIIHAFQEARSLDYADLLEELNLLEKTGREDADRPIADDLHRLRRRLEAVMAIDFFKAPNREEALAACQRCETLIHPPDMKLETIVVSDPSAYRNRRWVTRVSPHIDRVASAWLIRRYIDPKARFAFVKEDSELRKRDIPFDMFGVDFGHHGDDCSFETLCQAFGLNDPALETIARIVHDADLKDGKFGRRDTEGIEKAIRSLGMQLPDEELLEIGLHLFDGLLEIIRQEGRL